MPLTNNLLSPTFPILILSKNNNETWKKWRFFFSKFREKAFNMSPLSLKLNSCYPFFFISFSLPPPLPTSSPFFSPSFHPLSFSLFLPLSAFLPFWQVCFIKWGKFLLLFNGIFFLFIHGLIKAFICVFNALVLIL